VRIPSAAAVALLLVASHAAHADDKAVAAIQKQQAAAEAKCAADLVKCAKALVALKAFDEAREELRLAMALAPADAACRKEYAKLLASKGDTPDAASEKVEAVRTPVHAACVATLLPVLKAWSQAERPEEFARLATAAVASLGRDDALKPFDLVWHEPYLAWAKKADVDRWEKGDEFVDGAWLDAEKVKALDAKHTAWASPWTVGDGVHEVRTVMPLRAAKRVLEYVRAYRRFVIDSFAGEWQWTQSKGPLPIYLTETQTDYQARIHAFDASAPNSHASAIYLQRTGGLSPVFLTFEPNLSGGGKVKIDWPSLLRDLRHESAHQILFESAMAQGAAVSAAGAIDWVSEGVANFLACHRPAEGRWRLARPAQEPYGNGTEPASFAWVKANFEAVPPLAKQVETRTNIASVEGYYAATTLSYFLLVGADGRYRPSFMKMITEVHACRGSAKTFTECFGKVDMAKMQDEWKAFVEGISIEKN
jgi:hypothetical protein